MEDLKQFILEKSQYFNMKVICEKAGVNYSTFRKIMEMLYQKKN